MLVMPRPPLAQLTKCHCLPLGRGLIFQLSLVRWRKQAPRPLIRKEIERINSKEPSHEHEPLKIQSSQRQDITRALPEGEQIAKPDPRETKPSSPYYKLNPIKHKELAKFRCEHHGLKPGTIPDDLVWYPIYRFPYVTQLSLLVGMKSKLTLAIGGLIAYQIYQVLFAYQRPINVIKLACVSLGLLYLFGTYARQFIVQIYASEDGRHIRFVRYSSFGKRIDVIVPHSQVMPLTETNKVFRKALLHLQFIKPPLIDRTYDDDEFYDEDKYRLSLVFGGIQNPERFEMALGKILPHRHPHASD